eukprot:2484917-Heterocapsa_arctica.AAC.1
MSSWEMQIDWFAARRSARMHKAAIEMAAMLLRRQQEKEGVIITLTMEGVMIVPKEKTAQIQVKDNKNEIQVKDITNEIKVGHSPIDF